MAQPIERDFISDELNRMTISKEYHPEIISITKVIDNYVAVLINPAYRDFPNIVVFYYDSTTMKWNRPFETFGVGIQDETSDLTDLHTKGFAIDFSIGKDTVVYFDDKTKKVIESMSIKVGGGTVIPYQYFYHSHFSSSKISGYTIDKTQYRSFGLILDYNKYIDYPIDQCIMYDTPKILSINFEKYNNNYIISAITTNNQKWTITFLGLDNNHNYFSSKSITAEKINN